MLASAMTDPVTGAAFNARFADGWCLEEKLDGHRCVVIVGQRGTQIDAFSRPRNGLAHRRDLPPHILAQLRRFPEGVYDGELVAASGKAWDVVSGGAQLVLVLFDVLNAKGRDVTGAWTYLERRDALLFVLGKLPTSQTAISTVASVPPSWARVQAIWARGGEGVILKRAASVYRPGMRSTDWIKVKQAHAATLTITGYEAGKSGPFSKLALVDGDGHATTVKTLGNALLRAITVNPAAFLGRRVVITYQEKTPAGAYRHGIFDHFAGQGE